MARETNTQFAGESKHYLDADECLEESTQVDKRRCGQYIVVVVTIKLNDGTSRMKLLSKS